MEQGYQNQHWLPNSDSVPQHNVFANDGSFMEMFKNLRKQTEDVKDASSSCERGRDGTEEHSPATENDNRTDRTKQTQPIEELPSESQNHTQNNEKCETTKGASSGMTARDGQLPTEVPSLSVKKQTPIVRPFTSGYECMLVYYQL